MADDSTFQITQQRFVPLLLERVPVARAVVDDHFEANEELLLHLLMADLLRLATRLHHSGRTEELRRLLALIDDCLDLGDVFVENAVQVSFVEHVGGSPGETPEFIASWPAGLLAERDRQLKWTPEPEILVAEFLSAFGNEPMILPEGEITNSSRADWQAVLDALRLADWPLTLIDGGELPIPSSASELPEQFVVRVQPKDDLRFNLFDWGTVGFDIDLREITTQVDVNFVVMFMRMIGHATRKSVILSSEGELGREPVLTYDRATDSIAAPGQR